MNMCGIGLHYIQPNLQSPQSGLAPNSVLFVICHALIDESKYWPRRIVEASSISEIFRCHLPIAIHGLPRILTGAQFLEDKKIPRIDVGSPSVKEFDCSP